jgi:Anaphase-promoting complex subunit 4 WD40 domain
MRFTQRNHQIYSLVGCCLIVLLAACSSNTTPAPRGMTGTPGITLPIHRGITPISTTTTTVAMPPTQTSCPPSGTARAMIMAPLALGTHQNIIYTLNVGTYDAPSQGKLMRYDVQTGRATELLSVANANIYEAQVSADGQWVLFVTTTGNVGRQTKLQMIRLDGQGLQTLYCTPGYSIRQMQWSTDQHLLAFYNVVNEQGVVYLLDMKTGKVQTELSTPPGAGLVLRTWLDATHLYLTNAAQDTLYFYVYLLDTSKGAHQHLGDLLTVLFRQYGDFDSSYDGSQILISYGGCPQGFCTGPSSIAVQTITGGPQRTIYSSQIYDVIAVRVIDQASILFIIGNTYDSNGHADPSHNGLWKINVDGSGLTRLIPISSKQFSFLNYDSQELWSNISRDATMYVFQVNSFRDTPTAIIETDSLIVGSLHGNGRTPKVLASTSDGSQLVMAGWTVM